MACLILDVNVMSGYMIQPTGDNFFYWNGTQVEVVVSEPELVKEILTNKDGVYRKGKVSGAAKKYVGDGLVVAEGEKWSRLRKVANQTFHGQCLKVEILV